MWKKRELSGRAPGDVLEHYYILLSGLAGLNHPGFYHLV